MTVDNFLHRPGIRQECLPDQEIAISVLKVNRGVCAEVTQRLAYPVCHFRAIIISYPGIKQLAQNVQCAGLAGPFSQKVEKQFQRSRAVGGQVQI